MDNSTENLPRNSRLTVMSKPKPRWANEGDPESVIELTDILDEGSSGAVFEGIFQKRKVAVKVVPGLEDEQMNHEISTEIEILRLLGTKNPFFVGFYGAWEKDDHAWLSLELCEGGSIIDLCQICQTTLTEEESSAVAASVLLGLRFLHENLGYIHRDVKGKNILLTGDGSVKLTDLGIACLDSVASKDEHFLAAGSPHWMAPELCMTNHTSFANDVWSLGITLIELVRFFSCVFKFSL
jgi:serine/threonine protein kinase